MAKDVGQELDAILAHVRLGHGLGGIRIFGPGQVANASGGRGSSAGDHAIDEVNAELVTDKVMALVRELYGRA